MLSLGASGVISVLANVAPEATHDMVMNYLEGRTEDARRAQLAWLDVINHLFIEVNPIPVKEALNLMGFAVGGYRAPLYPMTDEHRAALKAALSAAGLVK